MFNVTRTIANYKKLFVKFRTHRPTFDRNLATFVSVGKRLHEYLLFLKDCRFFGHFAFGAAQKCANIVDLEKLFRILQNEYCNYSI